MKTYKVEEKNYVRLTFEMQMEFLDFIRKTEILSSQIKDMAEQLMFSINLDNYVKENKLGAKDA